MIHLTTMAFTAAKRLQNWVSHVINPFSTVMSYDLDGQAPSQLSLENFLYEEVQADSSPIHWGHKRERRKNTVKLTFKTVKNTYQNRGQEKLIFFGQKTLIGWLFFADMQTCKLVCVHYILLSEHNQSNSAQYQEFLKIDLERVER